MAQAEVQQLLFALCVQSGLYSVVVHQPAGPAGPAAVPSSIHAVPTVASSEPDCADTALETEVELAVWGPVLLAAFSATVVCCFADQLAVMCAWAVLVAFY